MSSITPEALISNWLDKIQHGRDGTTLLGQLSRNIDKISNTNAFYSLPNHLASQIITSAGEIPFNLATKIVDGFKQKIGKDAIFLLNCLNVQFNKVNNVAALLKHFVRFPMLAEISSYVSRDEEYDDEEGAIDVDYEHICHQLEKQVNELQLKLECIYKIAKPALPKNIRLSVKECIDNNDVEALIYLLDTDKNNLQEKIRDQNGVKQSGFCVAVVNGQTELAVAFVEHGADPYEKVKYRNYYSHKDYEYLPAFEYAERHNPKLAQALSKTGKIKTIPAKSEMKSSSGLQGYVDQLIEKGENPAEAERFVRSLTKGLIRW